MRGTVKFTSIVSLALLAVLLVAWTAPGPTTTTQGNLVVTDSLRVGGNGTPRQAIFSGPTTFYGNAQFLGGSNLGSAIIASGSLDFDLTGVSYQDKTLSCSGAVVGNPVSLGIPAAAMTQGGTPKKLVYIAWCNSTSQVTIRCIKACDETDPNPDSGTFKVYVW